MKKYLIPLLAINFVVAVVATGLFYGFFVSKLQNSEAAQTGAQVVVAARAVNRGSTISKDDLKMVAWPAAAPLDGAYLAVGDVEGKTAIQPIAASEPVLKSKLGDGFGIPAGMRAVTAHVPDSDGIMAMLRPGHHVDVQVVSTSAAPELKTILQDVEVLSVLKGRDQDTPVVTLLVSPADADIVTLADSAAKVRLVLRNPLDQERQALPRLSLPPVFQYTSKTLQK